MSIHNLANKPGSPEFYTTEFRQTLESHLPILKERHVTPMGVPNKYDVRYRNDFYGLIDSLGIERKLWWLTMRINGYHNSFEYKGGLKFIYVPDTEKVSEILAGFLAMR